MDNLYKFQCLYLTVILDKINFNFIDMLQLRSIKCFDKSNNKFKIVKPSQSVILQGSYFQGIKFTYI